MLSMLGSTCHRDYKIQLYFRRQKWMELIWGEDADYHRELVADKLEV